MIIDWKTDSLHYERKVKEIKNMNYKCPICKRKGTLVRHGFYLRNIILWIGNVEERQLLILRFRCTFCKSTHALLPKDVIPYHIYTASYYWKMLRLLHNCSDGVKLCVFVMNTYYNHIYKLMHYFRYFIKPQCKIYLCYICSFNYLNKRKIRQLLTYTTLIVNSRNV